MPSAGARIAAKGGFLAPNTCPAICPWRIGGCRGPGCPRDRWQRRGGAEDSGQDAAGHRAHTLGFSDHIICGRLRARQFVDATPKRLNPVWRSKMPHALPHASGPFFVDDSAEIYGVGTD